MEATGSISCPPSRIWTASPAAAYTYIGGVPVAQSVFGKDPFEPVTHSRVEDILHEQTDTLCAYIPGGGSAEGKAGVLVYEAQTNRDMAQIADRLAARSETGLLAGCAGFCIRAAAAVAAVLPGHRAAAALRPSARGLRQHQPGLAGAVRAGRGAGSARFSLTPEQKLSRDWAAGAQAGEMLGAVLRACSQEPVVVLDTGGAVENAGADKTADRIQIANTLGALLKRLLDDGLESTVLIMGSDCLFGPDAPAGCNGDHASVRSRAGRGAVASSPMADGNGTLFPNPVGLEQRHCFMTCKNILERWKKELPAV